MFIFVTVRKKSIDKVCYSAAVAVKCRRFFHAQGQPFPVSSHSADTP